MKKKMVKNLSLAMALVSCTTMSIPAIAQVGVFAATPSCQETLRYLQMPNFVSTGTVGTEYKFAEFALQGQTGTVEVSVKNPYGIEEVLDTTGTTPTFTPSVAGTYIATFKVGTIETDFEIEVKGISETYTISLPTNAEKIVPTQVGLTGKNNQATEIAFPDAIVFDAKGNVVDTEAEGLTVSIKTPTATNGAVVDWDTATKTLKVDTNIQKSATYKVAYEVRKNGVLLARTSVSVVAQKDYTVHDYEFDFVGSKPTTAEIGTDVNLPRISAKSMKDGSEVKVKYTVKVEHNRQDVSSDVLKQNERGEYVFTANQIGNFVVTYDIESFDGRKPSIDSTSFTISDVTDNTAPTPIVTLPYASVETGTDIDAIEAFEEVQTDANITILPIYAQDKSNGHIEDNLTLYRQIVNKSTDQVVFDESIYTDKNAVANKALVFNMSTATPSTHLVYLNGVEKQINPTQMEAVTEYNEEPFTLEEGTYIVKYIAKDKLSGKQEVTLSLPLEISATYDKSAVTKAPKVKFATSTAIPNSVQLGEVVTFKIPTASQEADGTFTDTHLSTYITYQLSTDKSTWTGPTTRYDADNSWIVLNEAKTEYTLTVPEWEEIKNEDYKFIKVIANSMNDAGVVGSEETIISLVGAGDDQATTVTNVDASVSANGMVGERTTLPTVTYADDMANHVNVQIIIEGEDGKSYSAQNLTRVINGTSVVVQDAYFIPEEEGSYNVTYISTDAGNNKTVLAFTMVVGANPTLFEANFVNIPSSINGGKAELGEKIILPNISTYVSSEEYLQAEDWSLEVVGPADYETDLKTFIKFNKVGDYTLKFVSNVKYKQDIGGNAAGSLFDTIETKTFTVTVSDTKGPQVLNKLDMEEKFFELNKNGTLEKNTVLKLGDSDPAKQLPMPQATDVVWEQSTLEVVATGTTEKFTLDAQGIEKLKTIGVTLSKDAVYQFIYTLKDANGNTTVINDYAVDVGDVEAPELTVEEGVVAKTYKPNSTVKVDMSKITANDNQDGDNLIYKDDSSSGNGAYKLKSDKLTLNITVRNTATSETKTSTESYDPTNLAFAFDDLAAGEYTLVVSLTDKSGKVATNTEIKFTVTDDAAEAATGEEVLGVVLIVVSVLMLGGVITYFVVTRKKYNK